MATTDEPAYVDHPLLVANVIENRRYQRQLAETALTDHTLVCLPTGLGKTTVSLLVTAARLHELGGTSLLLAPTKPLVEQHAEFYRSALRIPDDEIVVFTGDVRPADRADLWIDATVVVATPQVVENDLVGNRIDLDPVVHLTFDECHRATGDYAYVYIADRYHATATNPLVTGMSASPGDDEAAILAVCENLGISEVEVKTESDPSVEPYTVETSVEWTSVTVPDEIIEIRESLESVLKDRLTRLKDLGVIDSARVNTSRKELLGVRGQLQQLIQNDQAEGYEGMSIHAEVMKLKHAVDIVDSQGVDALLSYFERLQNEARSAGASKASQRLVSESAVRYAILKAREYDGLHPKLTETRRLVIETLAGGGDRVIVFTEYRDTAETLTEFLSNHVDARRFVGQGDKSGSSGMTQREQQDVIQAFRDGEFDVLVSTSVAEEGLDVPEVDLVLFYEPVPTAIRSIQRKGRTGRQSSGRVVVLMAEGTRDEAYFWISRRREREMESELRKLKGVAEEVEARLESVDRPADPAQRGLGDFTTTPPEPDDDTDLIEIVVDQRELDSTIGRRLSENDELTVQLETLAVGDYVLSDRVVVERKTVADFVDTLVGGDRSIFEQVGDMGRAYERPVVIIEGSGLYQERNIHPNAIRGALASLAIDFGASVMHTDDESETAALLAVIAKREQTDGRREVRVHGEKSSKTLTEQQEYVVGSIADIGPVTARSLLEAFGSVEAVMSAEVEELLEVPGVGQVTADRIREVVASDYQPE